MEWKIITAQICIAVLGIVYLVKNGDGAVLSSVIVAEATLGGVALGGHFSLSNNTSTAEPATEPTK